jgi:tRNA-modifying protein YgfZ
MRLVASCVRRISAVGPAATIELDAQYRQLREACGLLDRSSRGKLAISGGEAAEYLQGQLTNDIEALTPGQGCYAALLDRKGHMQADMRVLRIDADEVWIDVEGEALPATLRHLEMYRIGREVEVGDITAERAILSLVGPASEEVAGAAGGGAVHSHRPVAVEGVEARAVETAEGLDLICRAPDVVALREALLRRGAAEVSEEAAEILRVEAGRPRYGAEMTAETMPAEAGIVEQAVSFTKGCYIGQEPVARLHYRGRPNRRLRGLRLRGGAHPGDRLRLDGKDVGAVGTSCVSPALGPIALAIVRREADPGAVVEVGEDGSTAEVIELPFREPD